MYDIWVNYCEQGDENKPHYHTDCLLAGILYVTNDNELTYFKNDVKINGNSGDLVIFPGDLLHWTKKQQSQKERVTISFNFSVPMFIFNK